MLGTERSADRTAGKLTLKYKVTIKRYLRPSQPREVVERLAAD